MPYFVKREPPNLDPVSAQPSRALQASGDPDAAEDRRADPPALLPRGPGALPREVVATAHRRRLLNAMAQAVAEKGYVATSISDIVSRARVSRSAFYGCFADKGDCFLAGYGGEAERHFGMIAEAAAAEQDWSLQLRTGVRVYVRELERHPGFARSFLIEILTAGPEALQLRSAVYERYVSLMKDWYANAPAELGLAPLPDEVFRAAVGATNELVVTRLERQAADPERSRSTPPLEDLVLYSLLALFGLAGAARDALAVTPSPPG
jgi:AcrR family transcriptional regulator